MTIPTDTLSQPGLAGDSTPATATGPEYSQALNAALRFLSYRPRSEAEVRRRLSRRYFPPIIDRVILFLQQNRYLDDAAFAQLWRRGREQRRPRGRRALQQELRQLGVEREVIEEALEGFDAPANAYKAGQKLAARLVDKDAALDLFRHKVGAHLQRRGFEYSVVTETVNRLWQELAGD